MRIPETPVERQAFYVDIMNKCLVSQGERQAQYSSLRSYYLFGADQNSAPAHFNKIYPHIDQLSAFMYSADTTRFSIKMGASVPESFKKKIPALTQALHDYWTASNADQVFGAALNWAFCYNSTFLKLIWRNGIHPYMVEPGVFGVLREDTPYTDRQEAMVQEFYMTKSELYSRLYSHEKRDEILSKSLFLEGEQPFTQICPSPQYDYYYGQSEVQRLVFLQEMRNKRTGQILELLDKQVTPPKAFIGFQGILDEKMFALNRAGGMVASDMPNAKVEEFTPNIPNDLFREIAEIDAMFAEASGITSVLSGRGETGVRSQGHASQLARLGSSRAKKRALTIEDSLEKIATQYLKMMMAYDDTRYRDTDGNEFIAAQFTSDFVVKVDAHSNSPIFMEDARDLAFSLYNAGAISRSSLLEMVEPPMKDRLIEEVKIMEANAATQQAAQPQQTQQPAAEPAAGEAEQPQLRAV